MCAIRWFVVCRARCCACTAPRCIAAGRRLAMDMPSPPMSAPSHGSRYLPFSFHDETSCMSCVAIVHMTAVPVKSPRLLLHTRRCVGGCLLVPASAGSDAQQSGAHPRRMELCTWTRGPALAGWLRFAAGGLRARAIAARVSSVGGCCNAKAAAHRRRSAQTASSLHYR